MPSIHNAGSLSFSRRATLGLLLGGVLVGEAAAQIPTGLDILTRLFTAPSADPALFAPSFLAKIPIERVRGLLANVKQQLGAFKTVTGSGTDYIVHLAQGELTAHLVLNAAGQITGLLLRPKDSASLTRRHRAV